MTKSYNKSVVKLNDEQAFIKICTAYNSYVYENN
jgi:hypothetical protein